MKTNTRILTVIAVLSMFMVASFAAVLTVPAEESDADTVGDLGNYYCYKVRLCYSVAQDITRAAESVTWNFGDGSEAVTSTTSPNFSVEHTYAAIGDYTITQTATNTVGSSTAQWVIHIKGYPSVTYKWCYDKADTVITQTAFKAAASTPTDTTRSGYTFSGWYLDADYTTKYESTTNSGSAIVDGKIVEPTTMYAKWTANGTAEQFIVTFKDGNTTITTKTVDSGTKLSALDLSKFLAKDGKVYSGLYSDKELKNKWDNDTQITSNTTVYVKYTDVVPSSSDDTQGWVALGIIIVGIIAAAVGFMMRRWQIILIGIIVLLVGVAIRFNLIPWIF